MSMYLPMNCWMHSRSIAFAIKMESSKNPMLFGRRRASFREIWLPLQSGRIVDYLTSLEVQWLDGQMGEMNIEAADWYDRLSQSDP